MNLLWRKERVSTTRWKKMSTMTGLRRLFPKKKKKNPPPVVVGVLA